MATDDGEVYEGRLRWGGGEEALWVHQFNGFKPDNPWAAFVPRDRLPREHQGITLFGKEIVGWSVRAKLGRPFMARLGDIARIEPTRREIRVTLKSGSELVLDRFAADDLADGLRVWDRDRGVVDLREWGIRSLELLPTPPLEGAPDPLLGAVRTSGGDFTGLIQWDREAGLVTDELAGRTDDGDVRVRFEDVRSIARRASDRALVTLRDGAELVVSTDRRGGPNRGLYVDDARFGRVLVSWDAFERVDFRGPVSAPAYGDFRAGRPLEGSLTTRAGQRFVGRLVFDLDESETTETLDAPAGGVDYIIPFELIAAIVPAGPDAPGAGRTLLRLRGGEELLLDPSGDLGASNAGMLVFDRDGGRPEYVPWADVERVDFDHATER